MTKGEWISVKDELPKGCNSGYHKLFNVTVNFKDIFTYYAWYDGDKFYSHDFAGDINSFVTHWMPLPEPPESETK